MLTQDIIERFFLDMIADLREENIPILNDYKEDFSSFPYERDLPDEELSEDEAYINDASN